MQPDMFGMAWHALGLLLEPMRLLVLLLGVLIGGANWLTRGAAQGSVARTG